MDTKEYLKHYAALKMETLGHQNRILRAKAATEMPAAKDGDGSQHTAGRGDRFECAVFSWMEVKEQYQPMIDANKAEMQEIERTIDQLEDYLEREVLRCKYIDNEGWDPAPHRQVAMAIYHDDDERSEQRVKKIHRQAIRNLGAILEKEKSHQ